MVKIKLMHDSISVEEKEAVRKCLDSGNYTQGEVVREFEEKFALWNGSRFAVMVNSGSSANLIMVQVLKEKYGLVAGDEVLVPAVTWPTTIYPLIQCGLVPVICDVGEDFNISLASMERMISDRVKAVFLVHLLGQPAEVEVVKSFCQSRGLVLIEDSCESLGGEYKWFKVGTFGVMSSFSFYFGHHMTTIEGGMVVTDDEETYDLLKSVRSHGWVRDSKRALGYSGDTSFVFDMLGYNLRSTNVNAAIGLVQLGKLDEFVAVRRRNHALFRSKLSEKMSLLNKEKERLSEKVSLQSVDLNGTSSFALALTVDSTEKRNYLLSELPKLGVECRPIAAGNMLEQPLFKKMAGAGIFRADDCQKASLIDRCGLYLPNNQFLGAEEINYLVDSLVNLLREYHG